VNIRNREYYGKKALPTMTGDIHTLKKTVSPNAVIKITVLKIYYLQFKFDSHILNNAGIITEVMIIMCSIVHRSFLMTENTSIPPALHVVVPNLLPTNI
jgi:hypothetical protein